MIPKTLHAGLLLMHDYQWLDAAGAVDYLNNHSQEFLRGVRQEPDLVARGHVIIWHYIAEDLKPVQASSGPAGIPTCTFTDCPPLDLLIVPGADYRLRLPETCNTLLRNLMASERFIAFLTVCTGSIVIAPSGMLDGLRVCSNKFILKEMAGLGLLPPSVTWVGDRRWVVDGKVWSAAGVTAGIDLVAEFARVHFDPVIVELAKDLSEYEPKPDKPDPFARILEGVNL